MNRPPTTWNRVAVALGLTAFTALAAALTQLPAAAEDNGVPVVLKSTVVVDTATGTGTGFVTAPNQVVTAAHVVAGADVVTIHLGSTTATGHVLRSDPHRDVAVISVQLDAPPLTFVTTTPDPGSTVFAIGNPLGGGISTSRGIVSGSRVVDGQTDVQTDAAINPGNSGGPLVTQDGAVVGLVVSKLRDADGIALAVPASDVQAFLNDPSAGTAGAPAAPATSGTRGMLSDPTLWVAGAVLAGLLLAAYALARPGRRIKAAPELTVVLHPPVATTSLHKESA